MWQHAATEALPAYADGFSGAQLEMVVASILEGNTAAQLWTAPGAALLWDQGNNVFYLAGEVASEAMTRALARLTATDIRRAALHRGRAYFTARALSPAWEGALSMIFEGIALQTVRKRFYCLSQGAPRRPAPPRVEGLRFASIDSCLLTRDDLTNLSFVREEIRWMWPSEGRFLSHGFGCAALVGAKVICWCTAEYVSRARCGIGIQTVPEYQRRGVATATAARFIEHALARGIRPHWECNTHNLASLRVAEKLGFEPTEEVTIWAGEFRPTS